MHERKLNITLGLIIIKHTALLIILLFNSLARFLVALGLCGDLLNVFHFLEQKNKLNFLQFSAVMLGESLATQTLLLTLL